MSPTMTILGCLCTQKPEIDLKHLVKREYGENVLICDGHQQKLDNQGYRGVVFRVTYHLTFPRTVSFIVKKPLADGDEEAASAAEREFIFFEELRPELEKALPDLPIVQAHNIHTENLKTRAIILEDLWAAGFETSSSHGDVIKEKKLSLAKALCVAKNLAKIHAASVTSKMNARTDLPKIDWEKTKEQFKERIRTSAKYIILPLMDQVLDETNEVQKLSNFINSEHFLDKFVPLMKGDDDNKELNVLLHADCHLLNMFFKHDSEQTEMRFIDCQTYYVGPAYIDLLYFIYTSATQDFRAQNEKDLVKKYVETFNVCCSELNIDFDNFWNSYNNARLYGVLVAIGFRAFQLLPESKSNETDVQRSISAFNSDPIFQKEFKDLIEHIREVFSDIVESPMTRQVIFGSL